MKDFRSIGTKIVAVARNYSEHAAELKNPVPQKPVIFCKTTNTYASHKDTVVAPPGCKRLQHEVELGVIVGRKCSRAPAAEANKCIAGYVLALDMTARDLQGELKEAKLPWYLAKSFDTSCPVSDFIPSHLVPDPQKVQLSCSVNGQIRQQGSTSQMIFPVSVLIEYISKYVTLLPGDLILTGTPAGVSDVSNGDVIKCEMQVEGAAEPLARLEVDVKISE